MHSAAFICKGGFTMLQIYLDQYKDALAKGDEKVARRIERELASLGMDATTLKILVNNA